MTVRTAVLISFVLVCGCIQPKESSVSAAWRDSWPGDVTSNEVLKSAFSPDGTMVATYSQNGVTKLWSRDSGALLASLPPKPIVTEICFSPDSKLLMTKTVNIDYHNDVSIWDAATGRLRFGVEQKSTGSVLKATFSKDSSRLLLHIGLNNKKKSDQKDHIEIWDIATGRSIFSISEKEKNIASISISPDEKSILTVSGKKNNIVSLFSASTGKKLFSLNDNSDWGKSRNKSGVQAQFSPDGSRIVTFSRADKGKSFEIDTWDATTGKKQLSLISAKLRDMEVSPNGKFIATTGFASSEIGTKIWDASTGKKLFSFPYSKKLEFNKNANLLLIQYTSNIAEVWDTTTWEKKFSIEERSSFSIDFSPDGATLIVKEMPSAVTDGSRLIQIPYDPNPKVLDANSGTLLFSLNGHAAYVEEVSYSTDGTRIVTSGHKGAAKLWDAKTGALLFTLQ